MYTLQASALVLLFAQLPLAFTKPTPSLNGPATPAAVGDTTLCPQPNGHVWQLSITIQQGSGAEYDDSDLENLVDNLDRDIATKPGSADTATGSYTFQDETITLTLDTNTEGGVTLGTVTSTA